jgi:hypothetical protein
MRIQSLYILLKKKSYFSICTVAVSIKSGYGQLYAKICGIMTTI